MLKPRVYSTPFVPFAAYRAVANEAANAWDEADQALLHSIDPVGEFRVNPKPSQWVATLYDRDLEQLASI